MGKEVPQMAAMPSGGGGYSIDSGTGQERHEDETEYLLRNPKNASRLRRAIADVKAGRVITFDPGEDQV